MYDRAISFVGVACVLVLAQQGNCQLDSIFGGSPRQSERPNSTDESESTPLRQHAVPDVVRPFEWHSVIERNEKQRAFSHRELKADEAAFLKEALATLSDPLATWSQRTRAGVEIGYIGHVSAAKPLRAVIENRFDHHTVRQSAIQAMAEIGDPSTISVFIDLLDDPQVDVKSILASVLNDPFFTDFSREEGLRQPSFPQDSPERLYRDPREPGMGYGGGNPLWLSLRTDNATPVHHLQWFRDREGEFSTWWQVQFAARNVRVDFTRVRRRRMPKEPASERVVAQLGLANDLVGLHAAPRDVVIQRIPTREYWPLIEPIYLKASLLDDDRFRQMAEEAEKSKDISLPPLSTRSFDEWKRFADRQLNGYEVRILDYASKALQDPDLRFRFRIESAEKIGRIGSIKGIVPLKNVIRNWYDHRLVRLECIRAIGKIADRNVIPILIDALADPRVAVETHRQLLRICGDPLRLDDDAYEATGTTREEYGYLGYGYGLRGGGSWELADEFMLEYRSDNKVAATQLRKCVALHKRYETWWGTQGDAAELDFTWERRIPNQ